MSDDEAAGLFAELWFLAKWLHSSLASSVEAWIGSEGAIHDFGWSKATVEVKSSRTGLPPKHTISSLEQLEPVEGKLLYLFSLAIRQDPATGTFLEEMIETLAGRLAPGTRSTFLHETARRGFVPGHEDNTRFRYLVLEGGESLYQVKASFPRLTNMNLVGGRRPSGVGKVSYEIGLSGYDELRSEISPGFDPQAIFGYPGA